MGCRLDMLHKVKSARSAAMRCIAHQARSTPRTLAEDLFNAIDELLVWPWHYEVYSVLLRELYERREVCRLDVDVLAL